MVLSRLSLSASSGSCSSDRRTGVQPDRTVDVFAAQPEQRPNAVADLFVGRHQLIKIAHPVQPQLVVAHPGLHQQAGYTVLHLYRLPQHQAAVAQDPPPVPNLGRCHVALRQEIAAQAVGDLAGVDPVVLPLRCGNRSQHQRMGYLHGFGMGEQVIVNPAREDRRLHSDHPGLGKCDDPGVQLVPRRTDLPFTVHTTSRVLHAKTDRLLVNIQSDVIHIVSEEPPRLFSESACR